MKKLAFLINMIIILFFTATSYGIVEDKVFEETFVRETGKPVTEFRIFQGFGGSATVKLINGSLDNSDVERVSSSIVTVNGQAVFGPSDFNQNVTYLEKEIVLTEGKNNLEVILKGKPEGQLTIQIFQKVIRIKGINPSSALPGDLVTITFDGSVDVSILNVTLGDKVINLQPITGSSNSAMFEVPDAAESGPLFLVQGERKSNSIWFYISETSVVTPAPEEVVLDELGNEVAVNLVLMSMNEGFNSIEEAQRVAELHGGIIVGQIPLIAAYQIRLTTTTLDELRAAIVSLEADPAVDVVMEDQKFSLNSTGEPYDWPDDQGLPGQRFSNRVFEGAVTYSEYVDPKKDDRNQNKIKPSKITVGIVDEMGINFDLHDFDGKESRNISIVAPDNSPKNSPNPPPVEHTDVVTGIIAAEIGDGSDELYNSGKNAGLLQGLYDNDGISHGGFDIIVSPYTLYKDEDPKDPIWSGTMWACYFAD